MTVRLIQDAADAAEAARDLRGQVRVALDCEAAGFHRYSDRLCLVQLSAADRTYLFDTLAFDPSPTLREPLEDEGVEVVMHGADYDLRLLDRDLDIRPRSLFDTQVAAALLGEEALGLSALLERYVGVRLSKRYQRADWARRPLPQEMIDYAASDTRYLPKLADQLRTKLEDAERADWATEEFRLLESTRWEEKADQDPVTRVKGASKLDPRAATALRAALEWRDKLARAQDRAPFRVAGDRALLEVARMRPGSPRGLAEIQGISPALARTNGSDLIERLRMVESLPLEELDPYPRIRRSGNGRPDPEFVERVDRLKEIRNRRADELGIARGTLLSNAILTELLRLAPLDAARLRDVPGLKRWQMEALGSVFMRELNGAGGR